jgi:raffinose/stachyose/melibiose transport system permease protein
VTSLRRARWSTLLLIVLAFAWVYPVVWTLTNAIRPTADLYRAPWDLTWPPALENIGAAWERGQLGSALANTTAVTAPTRRVGPAYGGS